MSYYHNYRRNGGYGFNNGNGGFNYNGGYSPLLETNSNLSSFSGETSATPMTDEAEAASEPADPEGNFSYGFGYHSNNRKHGSTGGRKSNHLSSNSHRLSGSSSSISSVATTVANSESSYSPSNPSTFPSFINYSSTFSSRSSPSSPLVSKRSRPPSPPSYPILMNSNNNCNLRRPRKSIRFDGPSQNSSQNTKRGAGVEEDEKVNVRVNFGVTYSGEVYDRTPIEPTDPSTSLCLPKRESEKCCWIKCLERGKEKENNDSSSKSGNKKFFKQAIERMEGKSINTVRRVQIRPTPSPMSMEGGASSNSSASEEEEGIFSAPMGSGSEESAIGSLELEMGLEKRIGKMSNGHNDNHGFINGIDRSLAGEQEFNQMNGDFDEEKLVNQYEDEIEEDAIGLDMDGITDADGDLDGEDGGEEEEEEDDAKSVTTSATNVEEETEEESFCGSSFSGRFGISGGRDSSQNSMTSLSSEGGFPVTMTNPMGKVGGRPKSFSISSLSEEDETPRGLRFVPLSPAPPSHYPFPTTPNSTPVYTKTGLKSSPHGSPNTSVECLGEKVERLLKKESEKKKDSSGSGSDKEKKKGRFGMCGMGKWTRDEVYKSCDAFGGF